ncbi:hypothetical protein [Crenothrix sp.]|uniref:hypothetical protein n=1 Tax=Crenothrix sp. TaxID=3100433 RepID=UPI00374DDF39
MTESIVTIVLGSFVIWNLVTRYQTINSHSFIKNAQITVFIFASFAVGLSMVNADKTIKIAHLLEQHHSLKMLLFASPALLPIIFKVLQGSTFSSAFTLNADVIVMPLVMFFTLKFFLIPENHKLFLMLYFITFFIALGFIHSVLGGILASFNIALMVASFFNHSVLSIDLNSLFDLFEQVGVASPAIKWFILIASTLVGLNGSLSSQWLRELLR